jgi:glutamyl-tRNA reductase
MQSQRLGAGMLQQLTAAPLSRQQQQCRAICSRQAALQQHLGYNLQPLQMQRVQLLQPRLQLTRQRELHVVAATGSQPPESQPGQTGFLSSLYK